MAGEDFFEGIEDAEVYGLRQYMAPGEYLFRVISCKAASTRQDARFFAAELETLWSEGDDAHEVGETCSYFQLKSWDGSLGRIKGFIAASWGHDPAEVTKDVANAAVSEENPLGDNLVFCRARQVETKKKGVATNSEFMAYDEDLDPRQTGRSPFKRAGAEKVEKEAKDEKPSKGDGEEKARPEKNKATKEAVTSAAALLKLGGKKEKAPRKAGEDDVPF